MSRILLEPVRNEHWDPYTFKANLEQRESVQIPKALDVQEGGDHYKKMKIQPIEYILANDLGFVEGAVVKYVSRWESKGGIEDLKKARHFLDLYIQELEK